MPFPNTAEQDWEIHQIDVKSAYLCAPLKEQIFIKPLHGVLKPGQEGKVCHLLKGLYGLKQAGCGWYQELMKVLVGELGYMELLLDHLVFHRRQGTEYTTIAIVMDDMVVTTK